MSRMDHVLAVLEKVVGSGVEMNARQMMILVIVAKSDEPQTVRGLALRCKVSKPAITRSVDRLVEYGYCHRDRDPKDARSVLISLTETGKNLVSSLSEAT